jgi:hypothetical protein
MYLHVHMNNHSTRYEMTGTKSKSSLRLVEFLKTTFPQQPDQELDTMFVGFFIVLYERKKIVPSSFNTLFTNYCLYNLI